MGSICPISRIDRPRNIVAARLLQVGLELVPRWRPCRLQERLDAGVAVPQRHFVEDVQFLFASLYSESPIFSRKSWAWGCGRVGSGTCSSFLSGDDGGAERQRRQVYQNRVGARHLGVAHWPQRADQSRLDAGQQLRLEDWRRAPPRLVEFARRTDQCLGGARPRCWFKRRRMSLARPT